MTLDTRARRTAAVVALLSTGALGVGIASPALAAATKPSASASASAKPKAAAPSVITISALSSAFGNTAGGSNVVITGKGFSRVDPKNKSSVLFGKTPASTFLVLSDTQIAATAPAGTGTKADGAGGSEAWVRSATPPLRAT